MLSILEWNYLVPDQASFFVCTSWWWTIQPESQLIPSELSWEWWSQSSVSPSCFHNIWRWELRLWGWVLWPGHQSQGSRFQEQMVFLKSNIQRKLFLGIGKISNLIFNLMIISFTSIIFCLMWIKPCLFDNFVAYILQRIITRNCSFFILFYAGLVWFNIVILYILKGCFWGGTLPFIKFTCW